MKLEFHPGYKRDINSAARYYLRESESLYSAFADEVERVFGIIRENPYLGSSLGRGARKYVLRTFPYSVVYVPREQDVLVLAVAHFKRRPGYWRTRLRDA